MDPEAAPNELEGALTADKVVQTATELWAKLRVERERIARIDRWLRWDHDDPHKPRSATREYKELLSRSQAPWGRRVVSAVTDQLYVEGYRAAKAADNSKAWGWWQANGLDGRQVAIHESAVGYGLAYAVVLPGKDKLTDEAFPVIRGLDPSQMIAVYEDPAWDDWPAYALHVKPQRIGQAQAWRARLYDENFVYHLVISSNGDRIEYRLVQPHQVAGVCPVVRFTNHLDLRGRASGDVEPIIPLLGRIDQTTYHRLMVQHYGSWKVRTIAGMAAPEDATLSELEQKKLKLAQDDILVADDKDTKFGTLDETPLDGFIKAHDADVRALAALTQSPAHELIGEMSNMSAEALAAAEASLTRRVHRLKHPLGEAWEQTFRLAAKVMGDEAGMRDMSSQVHWADMEAKSLAQAADALGKLAQMLGVPVEVLWEKIPGWTQQDVDRAKAIASSGSSFEKMMEELLNKDVPANPPAPVPVS